MTMRWIAALCSMLCAVSLPAAEPALVRDGIAVGEFVLPEGSAKPEVFAVTDVRRWIREMTGADVPAVNAPSARNNTKVFVGRSFADAFADDLAKLAGNDGFAIRQRDGNVYVFGSRPRGTMYGVFSLLEKNSDIIWARPDSEIGTVFGKHKDLILTQADLRDVPVFWYRSLGGGHPFDVPTGQWQLRNRNNQCGRGFHEPEWDMMSIIGANLATPLAARFKDHPEYLGFDPRKGGRSGVMHGEGTLCLTHPGLAELWAQDVIEQVRQREARTGRKVDLFLVGPGDNWFCCRCDQCVKPIRLPGGGELVMKDPDATKDPLFRSTQIFMFLNRAMEVLKKETPHVRLAPLAYIHMAEPPAVDLHPDMLVYFAPYPTNSMRVPLLDPRQNRQWRERLEAWMKKTPNLGFYEYYYSKPSPLAFYAAANLRALLKTTDPSKAVIYAEFDNDHGNRGIGENALGWDVGAMNTWVIARLFWDPHQDVDALYRHYVQRAYREAAPLMLEYYEMIKASWADLSDGGTDGAHASIAYNYEHMIVKKGLEARCRSLLERAEAAAQHPNSKALIRRHREQFASFSKAMNRLIVAGIPEMAHDGDRFESVQWEKPQALDEFRVVRRAGELKEPAHRTVIKAAHDGRNLYVRCTAFAAAGKASVPAPQLVESWPRGDHFELWFNQGATRHVFAFNRDGHKYDARNYDRSGNADWRVMTRPTADGWEAIAVIPQAALSLKPGEKTPLQWLALREIDLGGGKSEEVSYQGVPLYYRWFPIVVE